MSYIPTNLGIPVGAVTSAATATTNGGTFVSGFTTDHSGNTRAVYWDATNNVHSLAVLAPSVSATVDEANDVNDVGSVFVGVSTNALGIATPVSWSAPSYAPVAFMLPVGHTGGLVFACSGIGSLAVGYTGISFGPVDFASTYPVAWLNGVPALLPMPAGYQGGAFNCARDGSAIVGYINSVPSPGIWLPVIWTGGWNNWSINTLGTIAGGVIATNESNNTGLACSNGGSLAFGYAGDSSNKIYAASWRGVALTTFGGLLGTAGSFVYGCDATGTFTCGGSGAGDATLWINGAGQLLPLFAGAKAAGYGQTVSTDATAIVGGGTNASNKSTAVKWIWSGAPIPGAAGPPTSGGGSGPIPIFPVRFLVCEPTGWTLTQPVQTVYGLDHLAGMYVIGLADGILIGPLLVSSDGAVTLPFPASAIILGMAFQPQLQSTYLDAGNPTIQGRRKDVLAVTVRTKSSLGIQVGSNQPDGAALDPPQNAPAWVGMQNVPLPAQSPSYTSPSGQTVFLPFTGDSYASVPGEWATPGQIAVAGTPGLPLYVLAVVPDILEGDTVEQTYSKEPAAQKRERPQRGERPVPGRWMLGSE